KLALMKYPLPQKAIQTFLVLGLLILLAALTAQAQRRRIAADGADKHYQTGVQLLESQQLDQAIAEFSLALKLRPRFAAAKNSLGIALARKGDFSAAAESF